ncbi:MAG: HsdM family class I SAM-dependent methyltransferase [Planctomycetota bacterium]
MVWNQNLVPFLLVVTPYDLRLYPGFKYYTPPPNSDDSIHDQSLLEPVRKASEILDTFADFKAQSINNGSIFAKWSQEITPSTRVDWKLLDNLNELSKHLISSLPRNIAHTLIGKYVYLHYLRDRDILSDRKLDEWGLNADQIFGRNATLPALYNLETRLADWLNGSVFPLPSKSKCAFDQLHLRKVASTFKGDDPKSGQMHLDFQAYDFAYIPIETLSVVYEQFLHAEGGGRRKGAYYTPIHLVNFILDELDVKRPLKKPMKVFDPSCGSGAFLVQCYRRLIERTFTPEPKKRIAPAKLSELLTHHIFGLEVDKDACGVTELSLILTLLDYVDPPDLSRAKRPLPKLRDRNIFWCQKGFFAPSAEWKKNKPKKGYDWIVGNPPWKEIKAEKPAEWEPGDEAALDWMREKKTHHPVSKYQLAEAFAWKVLECVGKQGLVGLLLPAATLFKKSAKRFRSQFFTSTDTWCVVNLANLRYLLFRDARKSDSKNQGSSKPAAAFFYTASPAPGQAEGYNIITYAPFAVDQLVRYSQNQGRKEKIWTLIVNSTEIREVPFAEAANGSTLPWKLAMWGSPRDKHLLSSVARRFDPLSTFADRHNLTILEGSQLKHVPSEEQAQKLISEGKIKLIENLVSKKRLDMEPLRGCEHLFSFPEEALLPITRDHAYIRTRGGEAPIEVCKPPHIIVDAARKFSVFSNEFIVVPARQIGIASDSSKQNLLKALSLYLSSAFVYYHQFLTSKTSFGTERDVANKDDLLRLPIPFDSLNARELARWGRLHADLVRASIAFHQSAQQPLFNQHQSKDTLVALLNLLNTNVYDLLGIGKSEQYLIDDLLNVRVRLNQGAIAREAVNPATHSDMRAYAQLIKRELNAFLDEDSRNGKHQIAVYYSDDQAIVRISHLERRATSRPEVIKVADKRTQAEVREITKRLPRQQGQWIYFNRGLRIFEGRTTYQFKPRAKLYWLKSQALVDADEFIAAKLMSF